MEYRYYLKGLNCPNCAAKIETDAGKLESVKHASVNLLKEELVVNTTKDPLQEIIAIVKKYEPDVEVSIKKGGEEYSQAGVLKKRLPIYAFGILLFLAGVFGPWRGGMETGFLLTAYLIFGAPVLWKAVTNIAKGKIFDENFLMSISTVGAICIGEFSEAVFVMLFYQIGEMFQEMAVNRSRHSIQSLMNIRPDFARLAEGEKEVQPEEVPVGSLILIRPGERVPLDGVIVKGEGTLDVSALTGESVPKFSKAGDAVLSGSINGSGLLTVKTEKEFQESTVAKILDLVENASAKKSKTERFITRFAAVYTPVVVGLAAALAIIPPLVTGDAFSIWLGRALVFLVVSCPCALVLSVPLGFFAGIGEAARRGILVKGGNDLQNLANLRTVVFDKTGTVTEGKFTVSQIVPAKGVSEDALMELLANAEKTSNHPIARSIVSYWEERHSALQEKKLEEYEELGGRGICAKIEGKQIYAGNKALMEEKEIKYLPFEGLGSVIYLGVDQSYVGAVVVRDNIKQSSKQGIAKLKQSGVTKVVMLSGDTVGIVEEIGKEIGADQAVGGLLPDQKVNILEGLLQDNVEHKTAFVGDGINDAPALARADLGIAMGGIGADAAMEAADMIIMDDQLDKIADGIQIAKATNKIVKQNIGFSLAVKAAVLMLSAGGLATMWMAIFADVGVAVLAIANAMRKKI